MNHRHLYKKENVTQYTNTAQTTDINILMSRFINIGIKWHPVNIYYLYYRYIYKNENITQNTNTAQTTDINF